MPMPPLLEAMGVVDTPKPGLPKGWFNDASDAVRAVVASGAMFCTEGLRQWAEARGLPSPPDNRAWGSVIAHAKRKGWIVYAGTGQWVTMSMAGAKFRPVRFWKKP